MIRKLKFFTVFLLIWACSGSGKEIKPERTNITESVYASVELQPDSLYQAFAVVSGIIEEIMVREGDIVNPGDPLIRIRNEAPELNLANARLAVEKAQSDLSGTNSALADLENQINTAELQKKDDSLNYNRQKRLWEQNIGSKLEYERKQLAYELTSNRLDNLTTAYEKLRRDLEINYQQAMINLRVAEVNTGDYTVRSRIHGKVYAVTKQIGEKVSLQEPVAELGSQQSFILELLIDERDIARIKLGQQVVIRLEAYEDEVFNAMISKIYPQKNERNQTFLVEAAFAGKTPAEMYAGLSGEASIIIKEREGVLTIPLEYLSEDITVLTSQGPVKVETGLRGLNRVEIVSGIDENTTIRLPND